MKGRTRETLITAFALFSLFFGAGNLILPPQLGFKSGDLWWIVALGFCLSAVFIPILGILAHARLQGTMFHFAEKISPFFSLVYCYLVYLISVALPSPRTASVTYEMAVAPFFDLAPVVTSILYFVLVFLFVMNRSSILNIIGKGLTPAILVLLLLIIGITVFSTDYSFGESVFERHFSHGILEGYQTFDAIGAVVVGGVIIVSINLKKDPGSYRSRKRLIARAGWLAGLGLFLVYAGLILTGALLSSDFEPGISRTALLSGIGKLKLGNTANLVLSILVALACFTTAVGIVTGASDFVKSRFSDSQRAYTVTALVGCFLGVLMGQFRVDYIIAVALPVLMFIYPITIILILLNVLPERWVTPKVFRIVIAVTILFSVPDFLESMGTSMDAIKEWIPLSRFSLGWVVPALLTFVFASLIGKRSAIKKI